jgi:UPF0755 protein
MRSTAHKTLVSRMQGAVLLRALLVVAALALLAAAGAAWWVNRWLDTPLAGLTTSRTFEIPRGSSMRSVANALAAAEVLDQPTVWVGWARLTKRESSLKAGEYELAPGMTPRTLFEHLSGGRVLLHSITFIEGSTFADIRNVLAAHEAVDARFKDKTAEELMAALGAPGVHPEGQFFPDTYRFPRGTSDLELLGIAYRRMQSELHSVWEARVPDLPLASPYEALILASIVEKETALDTERPVVAGVFVERLRRGMRLQTDPTVIYGMMDRYDGNIRKADLLRDTPYNTYTRAGLPPTPIAMPSLESLRAATQPQVTGALFFVATGEPDGSHYFSKTLAEHEAAVQRYLRKLRERR